MKPFSKRHGNIPHQTLWFGAQNFPIPDVHANGFAAVQTGSIDMHGFAGIKPADCQRFETSLVKAFLLTVNRDAILGGQVVKGCK